MPVQEGMPVRRGFRAFRVFVVTLARKGIRDVKAPEEMPGRRGRQDRRARQDLWGRREMWGRRDPGEFPARRERQAQQVPWGPRV